jgi:arsenite methyltransferase
LTQLDQWAEWLVRTRFACWSDADVRAALDELGRKRDRILDAAEIEPGDIVADVGAGTGLLTLGAVERVGPDGEVIAIDVSADALDELRANAVAANISYFLAWAEALPLLDESVDAVVTRSVLIYVKEKAETAQEFFRVLRPGGSISLFEPINSRNLRLWQAVDFSPLGELGARLRDWEDAVYANRDDPMLDFDEADLERLFGEAGFAAVRIEPGADEHEVDAELHLNQVGAPGRQTLLARWRDDFPSEDVERLVEFLCGRTISVRHPYVFLTARRP